VGSFLARSAGEKDDKALRIRHDVTSAVLWKRRIQCWGLLRRHVACVSQLLWKWQTVRRLRSRRWAGCLGQRQGTVFRFLHPPDDNHDKSTAAGAAPLIIRRVVRAGVADHGGEAQKVAAMVTEIQAAEGHPSRASESTRAMIRFSSLKIKPRLET
jgi:hypothetical protein